MRISDWSSDVCSSDLSVVEMGGADYMVRASGYLGSLNDFRSVPLKTAAGGIPVTLGDVATVQLGPDIRRGVAELNGQGAVAGGVIVMRSGKNARATLTAVKAKRAKERKRRGAGKRGAGLVETRGRG